MIDWPDIPELWALYDRYEPRWKLSYPGLEIQREVLRMAEWCEANKSRQPKKNWQRFMVAWLNRSQAKAEAVELREALERQRRHADAMVGTYRKSANG